MTIDQRLNELFAQTAGPRGHPITLQEVIDRMAERGISTMSLSYLQQLRSGKARNPRLIHLRALADAFGVSLTYLLEEETTLTEDGLTVDEHAVALGLRGLSRASLDTMSRVIEITRRSEHLDE